MSLSFIFNRSVLSGYFHFGNNHFTDKFPFVKNILQMLADGWHPDAEQLRHRLLSAPQGLVLNDHLNLSLFLREVI